MLTPAVTPPFPLRWGFSTRHSDPRELPERTLAQVHGCAILEASGALQEGDGHWTQEPGRRIGVRVADCVPILLAGLVLGRPWVAALHAGWRGAAAGILRRGVGIFKGMGGVAGELCYAFGPCIQACHFEVGPEVIEAAWRDAAWRDDLATIGPKGRPHLDLHGLLRAQALDMGLDPQKDGSIRRCTMCERDTFYSHRGGDSSGVRSGVLGPSGVQTAAPGASGVQSGAPGASGVQTAAPGASGIQSGAPGASGVQSGVQTAAPGASGIQSAAPQLGRQWGWVEIV